MEKEPLYQQYPMPNVTVVVGLKYLIYVTQYTSIAQVHIAAYCCDCKLHLIPGIEIPARYTRTNKRVNTNIKKVPYKRYK